MNVIKGGIPAIEAGDIRLFPQNPDMSLTTIFYALRKNRQKGSPFTNSLVKLGQQDKFDLTDPASIQGFFTKNILHYHRAARYMICTWDHGNGFGIFSNALDPSLSPPQLVITPAAGAIDQGKILTMDELANAFRMAFKRKKIDLQLMMNCGMQSFDAGYALRNVVKFLIAPETNMDFAGYNYLSFFRKLVKHPDSSSRELAGFLVSSFRRTKYEVPEEGVSARAITALFANDLSHYEAFADAIDQLVDTLTRNFRTLKPAIRVARSNTIPVSQAVNAIDFFLFLQQLQTMPGKNLPPELAKKFSRLQQKIIVKKFVGSTFMTAEKSPKPAGFTVFFPLTLDGTSISSASTKAFRNDSFSKQRKWHPFVKRFAKGINTPCEPHRLPLAH